MCAFSRSRDSVSNVLTHAGLLPFAVFLSSSVQQFKDEASVPSIEFACFAQTNVVILQSLRCDR